MQTQTFDLKSLARFLGRDARDLEKLAAQGKLPGRRVGGDWRFHRADVNVWLEKEMPSFSQSQLQCFEGAFTATAPANTNLVLRPLMSLETTSVPLDGRTRASVLRNLVQVANGNWMVFEPNRVCELVREREDEMSTALPGGVAIPHPGRRLNDEIGDSIIAYGRTSTPIAFGGERGQWVDILFLVLCKDDVSHLKCLARIARMVQSPGFTDQLRAASSPAETLDIIEQFESQVV